MTAPPKATVRLDGTAASLAFEGPVPQELRPGTVWRLDLSEADAAVLLREGAPLAGYFAGTLSAISLGELFGHLLSGVRTGRLTVSQGDVKKQISLKDGQVSFASSSLPHERLGAALIGLKMVSPEQVDDAVLAVRPGERLGAVLTRTGLVSPAQLYQAMSWLVREILLGVFEMTDGTFLFVEGSPALSDSVKLPERTRDLVLEGIRRAEEVHRLRRRWPPSLRVGRGDKEPPPEAAALVGRAGHGTTLGAMREACPGTEYAFLSTVDALFLSGVLVGESAPGSPRAATVLAPRGSVLEMYQTLVGDIARALVGAGKGLNALRAYLNEPGPKLKEAFAGVALLDDGVLDVERIEANLGAREGAMGRARTYEALDAFVAYALFCAQNALPREAFQVLAEAAQAMRGGSGT